MRVTRAKAAAAMRSENEPPVNNLNTPIDNAVESATHSPIRDKSLSQDEGMPISSTTTPNPTTKAQTTASPLSISHNSASKTTPFRLSDHSYINGSTPRSAKKSLAATPIHVDATNTPQTTPVDHAKRASLSAMTPGQGALLPKSPANQLLIKDRIGMRSTSNKENMQPGTPVPATNDNLTHPQPANDSLSTHDATVATTDEGGMSSSQRRDTTFPTDVEREAVDPTSDHDAANVQDDMKKREMDMTKQLDSLSMSSQEITVLPIDPPTAIEFVTNNTAQSLLDDRQDQDEVHSPAPEATPKNATARTKPAIARPSLLSRQSTMKSTKPLTVSTFQLPGETVAARLKAAREARENRDKKEEEVKRHTFKARPVPNFRASVGVVRQTAASKARQSVLNEAQVTKSTQPKVRTSMSAAPDRVRQSLSTAARSSMAADMFRRNVKQPRSSNVDTAAAKVEPKPTVPVMSTVRRTTSASDASPANTSRHRITSNEMRASLGPSTARTSINPVSGTRTTKGKAVFSRATQAKEAAEKEKREKEEAARKARAEAAERGRLASREWAAARKKKMAASNGRSNGLANPAQVPVPEVDAQNTTEVQQEASIQSCL